MGQPVSIVLSDKQILHYLQDYISDDNTLADPTGLANSDSEGLLAVAAASGCRSAVHDLLPRLADASKPSRIMGLALKAAAISDQFDTAGLLYKLSTNRATNVTHLWYAIDTCIRLQQSKIVPQLLKWLRPMSDTCPNARQKCELRLWLYRLRC